MNSEEKIDIFNGVMDGLYMTPLHDNRPYSIEFESFDDAFKMAVLYRFPFFIEVRGNRIYVEHEFEMNIIKLMI